ncbi:hypothetical protein [Nocardiopsis sp. CC223A]|uniref:hypothetical protein n=1 Tax=Nocardiopsis sp. CC223A TaxID=3044051 RepID=UPI00278C70C9|nr:hypothetical protein [Nocardiopsis sp. CC223A]
MDTLRLSADPARLPDRVRDELTDVDRLRRIWSGHRQTQPRQAREAARRSLVRSRIEGAGVGGALAEFLESTLADGMGGRALGPEYVLELADRVHSLPAPGAFRAPGTPLAAYGHARVVSAPAAVPGHPLIRAAHTYAETLAVVTELDDGNEAPRLLPWLAAALVLRRSDFPPLPPVHPPASTDPDPDERLAPTVSALARAVTAALRDELSWTPPESVPDPGEPVPPLAAVTSRRVTEHLRSHRESVGLILRGLDPAARAAVRTGGCDAGVGAEGLSEAGRAVLTPGAAHWWTTLELLVDDVTLSLVVVVQEIGRPRTGVLAVTVDGRLTDPDGVRDLPGISGTEGVTLMPTDCVDDRWPRIRDLVDEGVSLALGELTRI